MALPIIILSLLPVFILLLLQKHRRNKTGIRLPPGPRGLPFIGNLLQFDISNPVHYFWKLSQQYGPIVLLRHGSVEVLVISSAKMAKEVLKTHDHQFSGRPDVRGQQIISYNFSDLAFSAYSPYWREFRKICVVHLLNATRVKEFRPVREEEVSGMIEKISESAAASRPVNLSDMMLTLTSSIICRIAFGKRLGDEELLGDPHHHRKSKSPPHLLMREAQVLLGTFFFTRYLPLIGGWIDAVTGMNRRLQKNFKECDEFYQGLVDEHLDPKRPRSDDQRKNLIEVLVELKRAGAINIDLTWENVKAVIMNMLVGGTDSTAAAVVWAMTNLMKQPELMKRAQEEIRSHVGKNKGFVDEDDLQKLEYVRAVVKESLRLHPPGPFIPRKTTESCRIDGYDIPANAFVYVSAWAVGRDTEAWENAYEFNPDRFMGNTSVDFHGQHLEFIPFGSGRRICPGISMAISSVEIALSNLLYKFDWEMPHGMKINDLDFDMLPGVTMHKKNHLTLMPRIHAFA